MGKSLVLTAPKVFLYINGIKVGRVFGFGWNTNTPKKPIYGLDSNEPYELAPTTTSITGTVSIYKFMGDGGAEGAGMTPPNRDIPSERYFTLMLIDQVSSNLIFRADDCTVLGQNWNVSVRSLVTGTINFQALSWSNEMISV